MKTEFDPKPFIQNSTVIETEDALADFFTRAADQDIVAVDIESAGFYRYFSRVNLIQIATRQEAAIIDPQRIKDFSAFQKFARESHCLWVFHGGDYDISMLARDLEIYIPVMFDTRKGAELIGMHELGLRSLTEKYLGFTLDKRLQRCDWSRRPLTTAMKEYGLLDAVCLVPIFDFLSAELKALGRYEWVLEECEYIARQAREAQPHEQDPFAFRIKGSSRLSPRSMAVLREIWTLREEIARKIDRAPFMLLSNQALLDIARQVPRTISGLNVIKAVGRDFLNRYGQELQAAIRAGIEAELTGLEKPFQPREKQELLNSWEGEIAKSLREVRDSLATAMQIPPSVLAPSCAIYELARIRPETLGELQQSEILHAWQARVLAEEFLPILQQEPPPTTRKMRRRRRRRPGEG
ncbi:MAG TPA: HRDC domain-containing protein [Candidatus Rifleibacterium sp.]|nr:HRDC domain-containing protein [Candidatus Rifleibacterium sp.]HPT45354.1 HRDC domain-containing protein [Candidatus Rifleibacterium sp.]